MKLRYRALGMLIVVGSSLVHSLPAAEADPLEATVRKKLTAAGMQASRGGWYSTEWFIQFNFDPNGELTAMWPRTNPKYLSYGTWSLKGDLLTLTYGTPRKTQTMRVSVKDKRTLLFDETPFREFLIIVD
jgi:hypothetical protein